jgi:hypothetical protein
MAKLGAERRKPHLAGRTAADIGQVQVSEGVALAQYKLAGVVESLHLQRQADGSDVLAVTAQVGELVVALPRSTLFHEPGPPPEAADEQALGRLAARSNPRRVTWTRVRSWVRQPVNTSPICTCGGGSNGTGWRAERSAPSCTRC